MKKKSNVIVGALITAAALAVIGIIIFAVKESEARTPVILIKEQNGFYKPGDTIDINDLVEVKVKGEYVLEGRILAGDEYCELDGNGILHILDHGQQAMNTIDVECTATGSNRKSVSERVYFDVQNPINDSNSYEVTVSSISFRVYNNLKDQGNGVFARGEGLADKDYEIIFHSSDTAGDIDKLETEIREYAREKYSMSDAEYESEDVVLDSGEKARRITFSTIRTEGNNYTNGDVSGLYVRVVIYAFNKGNQRFYIEDNNSWCSQYEAEQIANTIR